MDRAYSSRRNATTDVLLEVLVGEGEEPSLELILRQGRERLLERHWLPRREAGGVGIQICPLRGACAPGDGACERALAQEAELQRAVKENAADDQLRSSLTGRAFLLPPSGSAWPRCRSSSTHERAVRTSLTDRPSYGAGMPSSSIAAVHHTGS